MADTLDPAHTCLLFFDTSTVFVNGRTLNPADRSPAMAPVVKNWQRQLEKARELGMMVAYAITAYRPKMYHQRIADMDTGGNPLPEPGSRVPVGHAILGTPAVDVVEDIAPRPEDPVFWKPRWNPFHQTALELTLRTHGIDTIVVNGGATEIGINATAFGAQALDFNLVVVSDGCTGMRQEHKDFFMKEILPRLGRVRTTDQVLAMLAQGTR
jgi:nicotinamidase-related amidase